MAQDTKTAQQFFTGAFKKSAQEQLEQLNAAMEEERSFRRSGSSSRSIPSMMRMSWSRPASSGWTALQAEARTMALDATKRAFEMVP